MFELSVMQNHALPSSNCLEWWWCNWWKL